MGDKGTRMKARQELEDLYLGVPDESVDLTFKDLPSFQQKEVAAKKVCGRVYCRQCVREGMGEMSEGRKCMDCLGKRFSKRYIQRAGSTGCCWRYPSAVKIQELIWAEKGPRRSNERRYRGDVASRSRSPVMMPGTPTRSRASRPRSPVMPGTPRSIVGACPGSFAMSPTFSTNVHGFPM